jgi:O-antigen ligase
LDRAVRWLPAVIAALLPTLFVPIAVDAYVLPRAALTLAGGGCLVAAGLLAGQHSLGPLRVPVIAVVVVAIASAVVSVAPVVSLVGTYARYESLPVRLAYLGLFCGAAWIGDRGRVAIAFIAGCSVAAIETLYQAWTHSLPRPDGNLGQPNLLGALMAMAIPLALNQALRATRPASRGWWAAAVVCAAALAVSTSRSGWLGALAGVCVFAFFAARPRRLPPLAAVAALVLAAAIALVLLSPLRSLNEDPPKFRLGVWRDSISVIAERPILGWGEDTMGLTFGRHQSADWGHGSNIDRAHSMPLDLAATQGVAGVAMCTWLFSAWWFGMWRRRQLAGIPGLAGAAAGYLASVLLNFDWAPATSAFWLLAGAAWSGEALVKPTTAALRLGSAGLTAVCGLVLAAVPLAADIAYSAGQPGLAATLDPLQPRYHAARGDLPSLRLAAALGDPSPSTYVALGDAEAQRGDPAAAKRAYQLALARYPYDPDATQRLASVPRSAAPRDR